MQLWLDMLYLLALSLFFCHELDAIQRHEWRLFAFLNRLNDESAYRVFAVLHIPLFLLFLWFAVHPARWFTVVADSFLIIHFFLHLGFRRHPRYEFSGFVSNLFIAGAAAAAGLHLVLLLAG